MTDAAKIIAAFEHREAQADRVHGPDHAAILTQVSEELGLPRETVREAMLDHWCAPMRVG
jgi:uncharacterized protein (DUF2126 family)